MTNSKKNSGLDEATQSGTPYKRPRYNFMIDCETLGLATKSVVVCVAVTPFLRQANASFDRLLDNTLTVYFRRDQQLAAGRKIERDTQAWWSRQTQQVQNQLNEPQDTVEDAHRKIMEYAEQYGNKNSLWYCRGPHFDVAKLESLFEDFNLPAPWHFRNVRDTRTVLCESGHATTNMPESQLPPNLCRHVAAHDAAMEIIMLRTYT